MNARSTAQSDRADSTSKRRVPPYQGGESAFVVDPDLILHAERSELWRFVARFRVLTAWDIFFPLDLSTLWRRHLIWSKKNDAKVLLDIVTSRYATTLTFLSLLFSAEVATYFSPALIVTNVRAALRNGPSDEGNDRLQYCAGMMLMISIFVTASAILANYNAMMLFKTVSPENASVILRSDIGVYAAQLPSRLTVLSLYSFLTWIVLFWWINLRGWAAFGVAMAAICSMMHVVSTFSMLSRLIINCSAMGSTPILPKEEEEMLTPIGLSDVMLAETEISRKLGIPVSQQYRTNFHDGSEISYRTSLQRRYNGIHLQGGTEATSVEEQ